MLHLTRSIAIQTTPPPTIPALQHLSSLFARTGSALALIQCVLFVKDAWANELQMVTEHESLIKSSNPIRERKREEPDTGGGGDEEAFQGLHQFLKLVLSPSEGSLKNVTAPEKALSLSLSPSTLLFLSSTFSLFLSLSFHLSLSFWAHGLGCLPRDE